MRRKDSAIQQQVANLQLKIVQEDRAVESRTTDLLTDWEKTKPVTVSLGPLCLACELPDQHRDLVSVFQAVQALLWLSFLITKTFSYN